MHYNMNKRLTVTVPLRSEKCKCVLATKSGMGTVWLRYVPIKCKQGIRDKEECLKAEGVTAC